MGINIIEEKSIETKDLMSDSSSLKSVISQEVIVGEVKQGKNTDTGEEVAIESISKLEENIDDKNQFKSETGEKEIVQNVSIKEIDQLSNVSTPNVVTIQKKVDSPNPDMNCGSVLETSNDDSLRNGYKSITSSSQSTKYELTIDTDINESSTNIDLGKDARGQEAQDDVPNLLKRHNLDNNFNHVVNQVDSFAKNNELVLGEDEQFLKQSLPFQQIEGDEILIKNEDRVNIKSMRDRKEENYLQQDLEKVKSKPLNEGRKKESFLPATANDENENIGNKTLKLKVNK